MHLLLKKFHTIKPKYQTNLEDPIFFEPTIIAENHNKLLSLLNENTEIKIKEDVSLFRSSMITLVFQ